MQKQLKNKKKNMYNNIFFKSNNDTQVFTTTTFQHLFQL